jgi:hypothetical protein
MAHKKGFSHFLLRLAFFSLKLAGEIKCLQINTDAAAAVVVRGIFHVRI